nr:MAG TPA: Integrase [Caudoviricetes sp.]
MAKYSYSYACGHGTGSVSLFGKSADRERKLAWYEQNMVCPECYKKQQAAADEAAEQVAVNAAVDEFDFERRVWTIPAERMKMRRPHVVPLAPPVCRLLQAWLAERKRSGISSSLLFDGIGGHRPLHVITQAGWRGRMTIHGLRKVFSTHAHESGRWSVDAIELQLAHVIPGVRGVYNKAYLLDERRRLMIWYAREIQRWRRIGTGIP